MRLPLPGHHHPQVIKEKTWQKVRVEVSGKRIRCYLDDAEMFDFEHVRFAQGRVGVRVQDATVRFRNFQVVAFDDARTVLWQGLPELPKKPISVESPHTPKQHPAAAGPEWVSLFNGRDLTGWAHDDNEGMDGEWKVIDGELDGSDTNRGLRTLRSDYADFHLRMDARLSLNANSGVYVRVNSGEPTRHYECELWLPRDAKWYTIGTIHRIPGHPLPSGFGPIVRDSDVRPDAWFKHEVIVQGSNFEILVDGKRVSKWTDPDPVAAAGALRLRTFLRIPEQTIRFRNIEILELPKKTE
jgi:hypothetical protein